jgi:hypothetical protein
MKRLQLRHPICLRIKHFLTCLNFFIEILGDFPILLTSLAEPEQEPQEADSIFILFLSVAEPHQFYAAPAPATGENFDAAPAQAAPAPAPTLLYSKANS